MYINIAVVNYYKRLTPGSSGRAASVQEAESRRARAPLHAVLMPPLARLVTAPPPLPP
jgi:hypothetical protein